MQTEGVALLFGKGGALVEPGIQQQLDPMKTGPDHAAVCFCLNFLTHFTLLPHADSAADAFLAMHSLPSRATSHANSAPTAIPVAGVTPRCEPLPATA